MFFENLFKCLYNGPISDQVLVFEKTVRSKKFADAKFREAEEVYNMPFLVAMSSCKGLQ